MIQVPGTTFDRVPLAQVCASANRVRDIIKETTGHNVQVRPVVVFAGWYIRNRAKHPKVWVVNENYLNAFLDHEDVCLTPEQVALYTARIADLARS